MAVMKLDYRVLNRQVNELAANSSRTFPEVVNQTALNVIGRAFNATPRAERHNIQRELAQTVKVNRINKKGKIKQVTVLGRLPTVLTSTGGRAPLAAMMINKRRGLLGKPGLYGAEMTQMIIRLVRFKERSIGFEASGWIPGMKEILRRLKRPFIIAKLKGVVVYKRPKGSARPATPGFRSVCQVLNSVRNIDKVGTRALQHGIDEEAKDVRRHLDEKMMFAQKRFNEQSKT